MMKADAKANCLGQLSIHASRSVLQFTQTIHYFVFIKKRQALLVILAKIFLEKKHFFCVCFQSIK